MATPKYYVPKFEEFHSGFRYLFKSNDPNGDAWAGDPSAFMEPEEYKIYDETGYLHREIGVENFNTWHKRKIITMVKVDTNEYEWKMNEDDISKPQIKVKYLNEMDLLELNWKRVLEDKSERSHWGVYTKGGWTLCIQFKKVGKNYPNHINLTHKHSGFLKPVVKNYNEMLNLEQQLKIK